ncbi:MAG: hypothetical protein IJI23_00120 [Lachnospiraceae bacterium]|nr:hypothetical protein [Lachnospiraceae bacterium]
MTPETITKVTELLITAIILVVSAHVIPYLRNKIGAEKMQLLETSMNLLVSFVEETVRAAEQLYKPEEWKLKKDYVTKLVIEKANNLGTGLNEAEIDAIIEGIVNFVKHNKNNRT